MKFSIANYPILKEIEQKTLDKINVQNQLSEEARRLTSSGDIERLSENGKKFLKAFNRSPFKISYFSKSIMDKVSAVYDKMGKFINELPEGRGLFLLPDLTAMFYHVLDGNIFFLHIADDTLLSFGLMTLKQSTTSEVTNREIIELDMMPTPQYTTDNGLYFGEPYGNYLCANTARACLVFYHLVEKEVVIISEAKSFKRSAIVDGEQFSTQSKLKIEIVDSSWWKTIIRTEGFSVQGHLRWQPHGINNSQKKLIWINEFQKHGYKVEAKITKLRGLA